MSSWGKTEVAGNQNTITFIIMEDYEVPFTWPGRNVDMNHWNNLLDMVDLESLEVFKMQLDRVLDNLGLFHRNRKWNKNWVSGIIRGEYKEKKKRLYHCIHGSSLLGAVYNSDMLCLKIYRIIKSRANSRQVNQMYKNTEERGFSPWKRDYRKEMRALYKTTSNMKKIRMENCSLSLVK